MASESVKVNADDFKKLLQDVEMMKCFLLCHRPYPNPEGELSDWAKKEVEEARKIPDSENISLEEVERMILKK